MYVATMTYAIEPMRLTSIIRDGNKENLPSVKSLETTN